MVLVFKINLFMAFFSRVTDHRLLLSAKSLVKALFTTPTVPKPTAVFTKGGTKRHHSLLATTNKSSIFHLLELFPSYCDHLLFFSDSST